MTSRRQGLIGRIIAVLRSSAGAWDINSVLVGVVVGAILLGAGGVSLFVVIPGSQDRQARDALDEVRDAQRSALSSEQAYLSKERLLERNFVPHDNKVEVALGYPVTGKRQVRVGDDFEERTVELGGSCFVAVTSSTNGNIFWATDKAEPQPLTGDSNPGCIDIASFNAMVTALGGESVSGVADGVFPAPVVTASKSASMVSFKWQHTGAPNYQIEYNTGEGWKKLNPGTPPAGWTVSGRQVNIPTALFSEATDLALRVASVNDDGSTSPTSKVVTDSDDPDYNVVELTGAGNALPNPGFDEGLKGWVRSDEWSLLTSSDTRNNSVAAMRLAQGGWARTAGAGGEPFIDISNMVSNRLVVTAHAKLPVDAKATVTLATNGGNTVHSTSTVTMNKTSGPTWEQYTLLNTTSLPNKSDLWVQVTFHGAGTQAAGTWALIDDVSIGVDNATVSQLSQTKEML